MAEATALFGMPGSTVLAAARVAGEWRCRSMPRRSVKRGDKWRVRGINGGVRATSTSEGICAGHGVVPVGESIASDLDYAGKPREGPPNSSALHKPHTPTTRRTRPRKVPRFVPLSSRTPAAKDAAGERFFHGCRQDGATQPNLSAGPFSAGRGRG